MLYPPELGFDKTDYRVFPHRIGVFSFGRWSVFFVWSVVGVFHLVGGLSFCRWSVMRMVGGRWFLWSVRSVVGGRSAFQSVVGCFFDNGRW